VAPAAATRRRALAGPSATESRRHGSQGPGCAARVRPRARSPIRPGRTLVLRVIAPWDAYRAGAGGWHRGGNEEGGMKRTYVAIVDLSPMQAEIFGHGLGQEGGLRAGTAGDQAHRVGSWARSTGSTSDNRVRTDECPRDGRAPRTPPTTHGPEHHVRRARQRPSPGTSHCARL
jgi:hypothetical protein